MVVVVVTIQNLCKIHKKAVKTLERAGGLAATNDNRLRFHVESGGGS